MSSWLDAYPDDPPAPAPTTKPPKAEHTKATGTWLDHFPDEPTSSTKAPHEGAFTSTAQKWEERDKARAQHASNASYQRSVTEDEANRPLADDVAAGVLAAGNAADTLGVADELRGLYGGAGAALGTLTGGGSLDDVKRNALEAFNQERGQQLEATTQAEENSPTASKWGQQVGIWAPAVASIWAKAPQAAAQALRNSSLAGALAKAAGAGGLLGAASGAGHGEGVEGRLEGAGEGALTGAALGAAGAALPTLTAKLAPNAAALPVGAGLRAAPAEAAANLARGTRSGVAASLDALAKGVTKAPGAAGAALGASVGSHFGEPVAGAGVGGVAAQRLLGPAAQNVAGKLTGKASALRSRNAPPAPPKILDTLQALTAPIEPSTSPPSGLELDTTTPKVNAEMARLKRALRDEQSVPVDDADIIGEQSATNPWARALANAREGGPPDAPRTPRQVLEEAGLVSPAPPPTVTPPPMPPRSGVMQALADSGLVVQPKGAPAWQLSAQQLRSGAVPAEVQARLQKLADDAAKAEPSTTSDTSGAAGFDDGVSAPVDEYGVPLDQFPLEDSVADRPAAKRAQNVKAREAGSPAGQPPAPPPMASPPPSSSLPDTAVMANRDLGRLRLQSSRADPALNPWSDSIDGLESPVFTPMGTELPNPAIREGWRNAAARHAAPVEGGPASTEQLTDEDVAALLSRGSRTKGGLQGSNAYWAKRRAALAAQGAEPEVAPDVRKTALELLDTSRTAPKEPSSAAAGFDEPLPSFVTKTADEMGFSGKDEPRSATWKRREEGSGVVSAGAEQRAMRLANRHAREDALPADRGALLQQLLAAAGVDSPTPQADRAFAAWKASGRRGPRPTGDVGGVVDAFHAAKEGKAPSSLLEAWENELRGVKTWRELRESGALDALAQALGVDAVQLPDEVIQRHLTQDMERGD